MRAVDRLRVHVDLRRRGLLLGRRRIRNGRRRRGLRRGLVALTRIDGTVPLATRAAGDDLVVLRLAVRVVVAVRARRVMLRVGVVDLGGLQLLRLLLRGRLAAARIDGAVLLSAPRAREDLIVLDPTRPHPSLVQRAVGLVAVRVELRLRVGGLGRPVGRGRLPCGDLALPARLLPPLAIALPHLLRRASPAHETLRCICFVSGRTEGFKHAVPPMSTQKRALARRCYWC